MQKHIPVLLDKVIEYLCPGKGKVIVDCTLGLGGHAEALLSSGAEVIGIDQDGEALRQAEAKLKGQKIEFVHANFTDISKVIKRSANGFLFDLGVSSYQIDEASRGFSIRFDGPLDMRMDKRLKQTASDLINTLDAGELTRIFKEYGEERFAKRISNAICVRRDEKRIETTFELKEIVEKAIPTWKKRESVTRIFQALRIAVNSELENLKKGLEQAVELLFSKGRIVIISYHSLEDRIVKHYFREKEKAGILKVLTKKPVVPEEEEINKNSRARSAKLRSAEKL